MPARPKGAAGCERRAVDRRAGPCASARMAPAPAARRWSRGDRSCSWAWWGWAAWAPTWSCGSCEPGTSASSTTSFLTPSRRVASQGATGSTSWQSFVDQLTPPRVDLADGAGRGRRRDAGRARAPPRGRRHGGRRRQLLLPRRRAPLEGAEGEGHPLRGRRHQRRGVRASSAATASWSAATTTAVARLQPVLETLAPGAGTIERTRGPQRARSARPSRGGSTAVPAARATS